MDVSAHYLYAIIRWPPGRTFDGISLVGPAGGPVYPITHNGLAAVVSDATVTEYDSTRANLLAHQRVLERVMQEFTLLPVRFGTVTDSKTPTEDVRRLLTTKEKLFHRLFQEIDGKVELGLKVLWRDEEAVFQEILAEDAAVRRLRDALAGKPPAATHYERIRLGEMVRAAMDRKRRDEARRLLAPLRRIAERVVENPQTLDRMVVNAAFLVNIRQEGAFDEAVGLLADEHGQRLSLRYVGSAPPFNFVNIVVNWSER